MFDRLASFCKEASIRNAPRGGLSVHKDLHSISYTYLTSIFLFQSYTFKNIFLFLLFILFLCCNAARNPIIRFLTVTSLYKRRVQHKQQGGEAALLLTFISSFLPLILVLLFNIICTIYAL